MHHAYKYAAYLKQRLPAPAPARYILLSVALKSNDMPPVLRLISASRSPPDTPLRSAATVAAALAPEPAGSPTAFAPAAAVAAFAVALTRRLDARLSVMSVECSRPLAIVQALSLPSVEMDTSSSSRSGPQSSQRTCRTCVISAGAVDQRSAG
eukprot:GHRQ01039860.1.p2 GENE.GHRQ01039860.1~~GHRQ01039860.1.p2  ORF type:complete len:153 (+),score=15.99 GHRQ01039860.1:133-591(+)